MLRIVTWIIYVILSNLAYTASIDTCIMKIWKKSIYFFYRHDVSASHVDPALKFILEACIAENDADRHITNIKVRTMAYILV